jgi:hypothetical protein
MGSSSSAVLPDSEATPEKSKERPLAARRSFIQSTAQNESADMEDTPGLDSTEGASADGKDLDIDAVLDSVLNNKGSSSASKTTSGKRAGGTSAPSSSASSSAAAGPDTPGADGDDSAPPSASSSSKIEFIPKSVKQIEEEVARHTAEFDASLKAGNYRRKRGGSSKGEDDKGDDSKDTDDKEKDKESTGIVAKKRVFTVPIQV